jgi:transcriptional regulator with PAS, ATPase and Fis domain
LVEHFIRRFSASMGKPIDDVDKAVIDELVRYDWPGNVRELENTIERAVVLATGRRLTRETVWLMGAVTPASNTGLPSLGLHENVEWAERETIRRALERSRGVKKDAAELMGISQRALSHYLLKYKDAL